MSLKKEEIFGIVGIVPRKNLWDIILNEKWYHIPVKSAPKNVLDAKFVGFYFPKIFGEEMRYKVIYYAPIKSIDIKKRIELFPEEVNHPRSNIDYYKINLGGLIKLNNPIISKRFRRIVHIPTTLSKLLNAKEINDLYHTSHIEDKVYRGLKRINLNPERQFPVKIKNQWYILDFCIFCNKGNIDIECDGERYHTLPDALTYDRLRNNNLTSYGWHVLRFFSREINRDLNNCIGIIYKTINSLGGEKLII